MSSQLALLLADPEDAQPASPTVAETLPAAAKERMAEGGRGGLESTPSRARDEAGAAHGAQALGRPRRAVVGVLTGRRPGCATDPAPAEVPTPEPQGCATLHPTALVVGSVHRCLVPRLTDGRETVTTCTVVEVLPVETMRLRGRVTEWRRVRVMVDGEDAPRTVAVERLDAATIEAALPHEVDAERQRQRRQRRRAREALAAAQRREDSGRPVESDAGSEAGEGDAEAAHG